MSGARREARIAVGALAFLLAVTAAWWTLALWPTPGPAPSWLSRARVVCFDAGPDGLPGPSGWLLLVGQPLGMLALLLVIWGDRVRAGLRGLARSSGGRVVLGVCVALLAGGLVAATQRVATAAAERRAALPSGGSLPDTYPRLDREAPPLSLVDQHGRRIDVDALRGRPALVTFAFGHCETVCPAVVAQARRARERLRETAGDAAAPRLVVVSLDPWRDTPSRLPHLADHWGLDEGAHVLSGSVAEVEAVLDGWNVARRRNPKTGEVVHPPLVYVLDAAGRIAFASSGDSAALVELVERARSFRPARSGT